MKYVLKRAALAATLLVSVTMHIAVVNAQRNAQPDPNSPDYAAAPMEPWEKLFTPFAFKARSEDGRTLPYRLYAPPQAGKKKKLPLVLFFHGAGERGIDNRKQFMRFPTVPFWKKTPCYVLAPQCPEKEKGQPDGEHVWVQTSFGASSHQMKAEPSWPMKLAMEVLDSMIASGSVDTTRIYVTGLSMGGFATWEILQREGHLFAAAAPVCGGGDTAYAAQLTHIPIWAFHGDADNIVPLNRSVDMIKAIENKGSKLTRLTIYPGVGHGAWTPAYNNWAVWDWLFTHKK